MAKGVAITHQNMTAAIQTGITNPLYAEEYVKVMIGTIPFYHACEPASSPGHERRNAPVC